MLMLSNCRGACTAPRSSAHRHGQSQAASGGRQPPSTWVTNISLSLVIWSHLVHRGPKGCAGICAPSSATAGQVLSWVLPGSPGKAQRPCARRQAAWWVVGRDLCRGQAVALGWHLALWRREVPWAFPAPLLCPTGDCVCMHPTGTPGACVPRGTMCVRILWDTMHACIPQEPQVSASHGAAWGPWGVHVRSCRQEQLRVPVAVPFPQASVLR